MRRRCSDALEIMIQSYRKLGLADLQSNTEKVYETNYQQTELTEHGQEALVEILVSVAASGDSRW